MQQLRTAGQRSTAGSPGAAVSGALIRPHAGLDCVQDPTLAQRSAAELSGQQGVKAGQQGSAPMQSPPRVAAGDKPPWLRQRAPQGVRPCPRTCTHFSLSKKGRSHLADGLPPWLMHPGTSSEAGECTQRGAACLVHSPSRRLLASQTNLPIRLLSSQTRLLRLVAMQVLLRTRARKRGIP